MANQLSCLGCFVYCILRGFIQGDNSVNSHLYLNDFIMENSKHNEMSYP